MSLEIFLLLIVRLPKHAVRQHLGETDDRVQGRPRSLVHMLARNSDLCWLATSSCPAFDFNFTEEPGILDGERRLSSERLEQLDRLWRERAGRLAIHRQGADQVILADQRYRHDRAIPCLDERSADRARIGADRDVGHLDRLALAGKSAENTLIPFA